MSPLALDVVTKTDKTPVLGRMLSKVCGTKKRRVLKMASLKQGIIQDKEVISCE